MIFIATQCLLLNYYQTLISNLSKEHQHLVHQVERMTITRMVIIQEHSLTRKVFLIKRLKWRPSHQRDKPWIKRTSLPTNYLCSWLFQAPSNPLKPLIWMIATLKSIYSSKLLNWCFHGSYIPSSSTFLIKIFTPLLRNLDVN